MDTSAKLAANAATTPASAATAPETDQPLCLRRAVAIVAAGGRLFGCDTSVISSVISGAILFVKDEFLPSSMMKEFVVSAGQIVGLGVMGAAF